MGMRTLVRAVHGIVFPCNFPFQETTPHLPDRDDRSNRYHTDGMDVAENQPIATCTTAQQIQRLVRRPLNRNETPRNFVK